MRTTPRPPPLFRTIPGGPRGALGRTSVRRPPAIRKLRAHRAGKCRFRPESPEWPESDTFKPSARPVSVSLVPHGHWSARGRPRGRPGWCETAAGGVGWLLARGRRTRQISQIRGNLENRVKNISPANLKRGKTNGRKCLYIPIGVRGDTDACSGQPQTPMRI